jgi:hypothetical protein
MIRGEGNFKKITNKKKQNHLLDMIRSSWPLVYTVVTDGNDYIYSKYNYYYDLLYDTIIITIYDTITSIIVITSKQPRTFNF